VPPLFIVSTPQDNSNRGNSIFRRVAAIERTLAHLGRKDADVKASFDQMMSHTTQQVADDMAREFATIDQTIRQLDANLPNREKVIQTLNSLRNHIPMRFNIPENVRIPLSEIKEQIIKTPDAPLELGLASTHTTPTK
jgi:hypothetical protein